jgi:DNA mismatch endonuclease (patch repair protein)
MSVTPSLERSRQMALVRGKDTKPEMAVRRLVHRLGYRYRLHRSDLPGKPDLVFPSRRKVILVHGCFWHRHADPACKLARMPKSRLEFWEPKLSANAQRDARTLDALSQAGWSALTLWECEIKSNRDLEGRIIRFLES